MNEIHCYKDLAQNQKGNISVQYNTNQSINQELPT